MDSVMKGLMGQCFPQNFWARTAPDIDNDNNEQRQQIISQLSVTTQSASRAYSWKCKTRSSLSSVDFLRSGEKQEKLLMF